MNYADVNAETLNNLISDTRNSEKLERVHINYNDVLEGTSLKGNIE